ncbi:ThiJ/PfpI family protein [Moritella sp. JT01]|nr:ThiJ/PfpI family protein [Moritella sp. JT01]
MGLGVISTSYFANAVQNESLEPHKNAKQNKGAANLNVGIFLYPNMTMLDAYGPLQVLALVPELNTFTFAKTFGPLPCDAKIDLLPNYGFSNCPPIDILIVPGAANPAEQMQDEVVIEFLRNVGNNAKYVTSVCTGALILAKTGLLDNYQSTIHWAYADALKAFPKVTYVDSRVVIDRNRISGGGVTSGLDFAFRLIAETVGENQAKAMELLLEYDPQPPFNSGDHNNVDPDLKRKIQERVYHIAKELF